MAALAEIAYLQIQNRLALQLRRQAVGKPPPKEPRQADLPSRFSSLLPLWEKGREAKSVGLQ